MGGGDLELAVSSAIVSSLWIFFILLPLLHFLFFW